MIDTEEYECMLEYECMHAFAKGMCLESCNLFIFWEISDNI